MIVLADVPRLRNDQVSFLKEFSDQGGGVLILAGARAGDHVDIWNQDIHKAGWLPARLEKIVEPSKERPAPTLDLRSGSFSPLQVFRDQSPGALAQASFPKWWKLAPVPAAAPVAWLSNGDPWIVEQAVGKGRVLLCATPLDRSWHSTLPTLPEFPILIHELTRYLSGDSFGRLNLPPGQPFRWTPAVDQAPPRILLITGPDNKTRTQRLTHEPWLVFPDAGPGAYQVSTEMGESRRFVSTSDPRESDLTPCTDEDRKKVRELLSLGNGETDGTTSSAEAQQDLWWLFLLGVVMLLVGEIWLTRRMALNRLSLNGPSFDRQGANAQAAP